MKKMSFAVLSIMCLILVAGAALADRQVTVPPVTVDAIPFNSGINPNSVDSDCEMGNLNPFVFPITDRVLGAEKYKYLFYADPAQCPSCTEGFTVEGVSIFLQFGPEDVPSTFAARIDFEEAIWDDDLQCWYPGPEICISTDHMVGIQPAGVHKLTIEMDADCACVEFGHWYGISFEILNSFPSGMEPDIITDDIPVGCVSWNDSGSGWIDVLDLGFPGEINMSAEFSCCSDPVSTEKNTWGEIKTMFR